MEKLFEINVSKYSDTRSFVVYRPSSLDNPISNTVMFVMEKYIDKAESLSLVDDCLVFWPSNHEIPASISNKHVFVKSIAPRKDYNRFFRDNNITNYPQPETFDVINGAYICKGAIVGKQCSIMPGAYIGSGVVLGDSVYIGCGTKLVGSVVIGNDVVIRENTVIGADGLTTERDNDGTALTMPQFGGVIIHDKVQIGANVVICRGAIDNTIIGTGSKIDNSCFISHNVILEENVFIVGETIMMGSSRAKKNAYISGNTTIRNKITIQEESFVGMGSVVTKDVISGTIVLGNPAKTKESKVK